MGRWQELVNQKQKTEREEKLLMQNLIGENIMAPVRI
tara:strand:- start:152 stop:262 length:111 start_codon:yes stop_codon:yes gene_type:complete